MNVSSVYWLIFYGFLTAMLLFVVHSSKQSSKVSLTNSEAAKALDWSRIRESSRIYFHETSDKGYLNLEQSCCVESAAYHNPNRKIYVYLSDNKKLNTSSSWLEILKSYRNIIIRYINHQDYFTGTLLEKWYRNGSWIESPFKTAHLSDYIRIITAHKYGGLYLDLDMLVLKKLDDSLFKNCLIFDNLKSLVENAFFHFERNHPFVKEVVKLLADGYKPNEHINHGPEAFTKALKRYCNITSQFFQVSECREVKIFPHRMIDPFGYYLWDIYFQPQVSRQHLKRVYQSFAIHHFRSASLKSVISMTSNQLFGFLAQQNCPVTTKIKFRN